MKFTILLLLLSIMLLESTVTNPKAIWSAAKHCGLWWAFYDIAVVIPKPSIIHLDSEYKLHAEGKPALVYRGFESYAHHGRYIKPEEIT